MKSTLNLVGKLTLIFISLFILINCSAADDSLPASIKINIEDAKLLDFLLFGIAPTKIEIISLEIINNK